MMVKTLFIYHGNCFDGFTAAWIYSRFVDRDATFYGAKYGEPPPDVMPEQRVIVADFSYPRDVMIRLREQCDLLVLDHHKTAAASCAGLLFCCFDMTRCGAVMTWERFVPGSAPPPFVQYIQDRDLWTLALPGTEEHAALVSATPMTFEAWDAISKNPQANIEAGRGILRYIHQYGTKAIAEAHAYFIRGIICPTINVPYMNCSEHVNRLLAETGARCAASYFRRADGRWQFSLRSVAPFDCSEIAKSFGGGGHAQAAGFDVAMLEEVFG
jgi:oligoribonuclease NrnB/cAMP/cGMP phosphodiesterase (DHH superfamily)